MGRSSSSRGGPARRVRPRWTSDGRSLLPGLITCHTHLTEVYPFAAADGETSADSALRALGAATQALHAGVTTIRCVHEQNQADLWLRAADERGWVRTPRILAGRSGDHDHRRARRRRGRLRPRRRARRVPEGRAEELAAGADHIKIFISGGIGDASENITTVQMTLDEMRAMVSAAEVHGAYVVAHAGNSASIALALDAGVRAFEHGTSWTTRLRPRWSRTRRVPHADDQLSPTSAAGCSPGGSTSRRSERAAEVEPMHARSLETAIRHGVTIVNGTDGHPAEPVDGTSMTVVEAELLVARRARAARGAPRLDRQRRGARGARVPDREGRGGVRGRPDRRAGDPLEDIGALRSIDWVMSRGEVVRDDRDQG